MDLLRARIQVDRELVRRGTLFDFFKMAWPLVDPAPLVPNWHLDLKCTHLQAVSEHEIKRLLINEPPGCAKSNTVNVIWNAWEWIHRPITKFLYASYDASLVGTRDGGKLIKLLQSDWFVARWGELLPPGKPAASAFETRAGGFRFSTSPSGKGTGRHGDIRVIDDPLKPKDAAGGATQTANALRFVSGWMANTWSSRATNQTTVRDVLVMQRLHDEDPSGEWLARGDVVHLRLPMRYDPEDPCETPWGKDPRTQPGELLFPQRFPEEVVQKMHDLDMGPEVFEAQCQQRPQRKGGGVFKRDDWRFWHFQEGVPEPCLCKDCWRAMRTLPGHVGPRMCQPLPPSGFESQSWDCAFKKTELTDFVCGAAFRVNLGLVFLLDLVNERMRFSETVQAIRDMSLKHPQAYDKLIEDKANGPAVEDALSSEIPGLTLVTPMGGKEARANAGSIFFTSHRFFVPHPEIVPWVWAYMRQHEAFPKSVNDDQVDATSQFLVYLRANGTNVDQFAQAMRRLRGEK